MRLGRSSGTSQSGVPSASVGSIVQAVKAMPSPATSARIDAGSARSARDRPLKRADVVAGILQRPVGLQLTSLGCRQPLVDHAVL